ncbi:MAG: hypothetical protein V4504_00195 [Patescibacteria group bacterium]
MNKKIDYYENFLKNIEFQEKIIQRKNSYKIVFSIAMLLITILALSASVIKGSPFSEIFLNKQDKQIIDINNRVEKINTNVENLSSSLVNNKDLSFVYLNSKIQEIQQKNSYLYETILANPDSAITPKILKQEQDTINDKIIDLKAQINKTNSLLSTILVALLVGIICFIGKQVWETYFSKKNLLKQ